MIATLETALLLDSYFLLYYLLQETSGGKGKLPPALAPVFVFIWLYSYRSSPLPFVPNYSFINLDIHKTVVKVSFNT